MQKRFKYHGQKEWQWLDLRGLDGDKTQKIELAFLKRRNGRP